MSTVPVSYKPSPLSYGSPRASPFRRPDSPASPSPLRNSTSNTDHTNTTTPTTSPIKAMGTPSTFKVSTSSRSDTDSWTPRGLVATIPPPRETDHSREPERSPTRGANSSPHMTSMSTSMRAHTDTNALAKLQPGQVRELREGFQILDRDSDGIVGREDVADMLNQLGLPSSASDVSPFFPPASQQTIMLPTFLTQVSTLLACLSPPSELLSAFAAFDDDDSGQVDLAELRDALLHTAPEPGESSLTEREVNKIMSGFSGRRAFGKSAGKGIGKRGEVFKYQEFVGAIAGGVNSKAGGQADEE